MLAALLWFGSIATATGPAYLCQDFFVRPPDLTRPADRAWTSFRSNAVGLAPLDDPFTLIETTWRAITRARTDRSARRLAILPTTDEERALLCAALTPTLLESQLVFHDADLVWHVLDQLCALNRADVLAVTEGALGIADVPGANGPARAQVNHWLHRVIDGPAIGADDWRGLIAHADPDHVLVLADAVARRWNTLGLDDDDRLSIARRFLRADRAVATALGVADVGADRLLPFVDDLSPLQWLELARLRGPLTPAEVGTFADRVRRYRGPRLNTWPGARAERTLLDLLYDDALPYGQFTRVLEATRAHWPARYGTTLPNLVYRPRKLTGAQRERAETFFGQLTVSPRRVFQDSRRYARGIGLSLSFVRFTTADEFVDRFSLTRHCDLPRPGRSGELSRVDEIRVRDVKDAYFAALEREVPRVLRTEPNARQIRWLLETPRQFPATSVEHSDVRDRVRAVRTTILDWAMARVTTIDEWSALIDAADDSSLVDRFLHVALRVGPGDLSWLDRPNLGSSAALGAWRELRNALAPARRSDDALMAHALELVLDDPESEGTAARPRRRDWFVYLAARGRAGAIAHVNVDYLARLRALALQSGYWIDVVARDRVGAAVVVKDRT